MGTYSGPRSDDGRTTAGPAARPRRPERHPTAHHQSAFHHPVSHQPALQQPTFHHSTVHHSTVHQPAAAARRRRARATCPVCATAIGRDRAGRPGRDRGFCSNCRTPFSFVPPLAAGDMVGGYEIIDCLSAGGPGPGGWVYRAWDRNQAPGRERGWEQGWERGRGQDDPPGSQVVIKSLWRARHRQAHAGRSAAARPVVVDPAVRHPAIVRMLGELEHAGVTHAVMELVEGSSLADLLRSRRAAAAGGRSAPLPVPVALAGVGRLLSALDYLHGRGLVFCDVAPGNVVWNGDRATFVDLQAIRSARRRTGTFHVTAGFDAPELAESPPSVASDLYALGRLLAVAVLDFPDRASVSSFMIRRTLPNREDVEVLARHEPLHRFLLRATAAEPERRFATAREMSRALAEVAAGLTPGPETGSVTGLADGPAGGSTAGSWASTTTVDPASIHLGDV